MQGRSFDDVLGAGWRLVIVDTDPRAIDHAARSWFGSIGGMVIPVTDTDPVYCPWFTDHDVTCALQRPDFHLYGTATSAAGASALLDDLRRQLSSDHAFQGARP